MCELFTLATFFAGCGGLDLGFKQAGFNLLWSNEFDSKIHPTHKLNFPDVEVCTDSITKITAASVPDVDGFIGGPPCQSWSEAGAKRGRGDARGELFFNYIDLIKAKQPKFFLAENVSGILHSRHEEAFKNILQCFSDAGYDVFFKLMNANDYNTPQDRLRVIIIGFRKDLGIQFEFPQPIDHKPTLKDAIWDLKDSATPAKALNHSHCSQLPFPNHEFMIGGFSPMFMTRNRVRSWDQPSFTIQASGRHAPLHPSAPTMEKTGKDQFVFKPGCEDQYRRLSVRECARIQTFPDDFVLDYKYINDGYKMIGNAVPVEFAKHIALAIKNALLVK